MFCQAINIIVAKRPNIDKSLKRGERGFAAKVTSLGVRINEDEQTSKKYLKRPMFPNLSL
jgi:hypothetical protein